MIMVHLNPILSIFQITSIPGQKQEADMVSSERQRTEFHDLFSGTGCFKCTFSLQIKENRKLFKHHQEMYNIYITSSLQKVLDKLQEQNVIIPLGVDETGMT